MGETALPEKGERLSRAPINPQKTKEQTMTDQTPDYKAMSSGEMLTAIGMDGQKWTEAYYQIWPEGCPDRETMHGWFCNSLMSGYDAGLAACGKRAAMSADYPE